jgi:hypothetical protein
MCFRESGTPGGQSKNSSRDDGAPVRCACSFPILVAGAKRTIFCPIFVSSLVFHLSAMESDPFHQNDELDKIPSLP